MNAKFLPILSIMLALLAWNTTSYALPDDFAAGLTCPADLELECADPNNDNLIAEWLTTTFPTTDCAAGILRINNNYALDRFSDECGMSGRQTVRFTVTDNCASTATCTARIIIRDNTPPVFTAEPQPITVECDGAGNTAAFDAWIADHGGAEAEDACGTVSWEYQIVSEVQRCGNTKRIRVAFIAKDDCNKQARMATTFDIVDTQAPIITQPAQSVLGLNCNEIDVNAAFQDWVDSHGGAEATDLCGDVIWSYSGGISNTCGGLNPFVFTATDGCGNAATTKAYFTVVDHTPPVVKAPKDKIISCGGNYNFGNPTISDCSAYTTKVEDYYIGDGSCPTEETKVRRWIVTDDCGNVTTAEQRIFRRDTVPPRLRFTHSLLRDLEDGGELIVDCSKVPTFNTNAVFAFDQCDVDGVDIQMDEPGRYESYSPCGVDGQTLDRMFCRWTAMDDCGNMSSITLYITIVDTTKPIIQNDIQPVEFNCGREPRFISNLRVKDCSEVTIQTFDREEGTPCTDGYKVTRTWIVKDRCGNSTSASQVATMRPGTGNLAFVEIPQDEVLPQNGAVVFGEPKVRSLCPDGYNLTFEDTGNTGTCEQVLIRTWTATDACGNRATASQQITLRDMDAPRFTWVPEDQLVPALEAVPARVNPGVQDKGRYSLDFKEQSEKRSDGTTLITRTWTATDACGNVNTANQRILVGSEAELTFLSVQGAQSISCDASPKFDRPSVASKCGEVMLRFSDEEKLTACNGRVITRTWTAKDACGNTGTAVQKIVISDKQGPVFENIPQGKIVYCGASLAFEQPEVSDGCGSVKLHYQDEISGDENCTADYWVTRTWTARDACGNISTAAVTYWVQPASETQSAPVPNAAVILTHPGGQGAGGIQVYPNPVSGGNLNVVLTSETDGEMVLSLFNGMGQEVKRLRTDASIGNNTLDLDMSSVPAGTYYLKVADAAGHQYLQRVLKQ